MHKILELQNINKSFGEIKIFENLNFTINSTESIAILGSSGCGKTTFLQICGLLDFNYSGSIIINQKPISQTDASTVLSKNIGFIFQFANLLPEFTVLQNLEISQKIAGITDKDFCLQLLFELGLENKQNSKIQSLSGGESQRVAIARALAKKPSLILADEPTGNLDEENAHKVFNLLTSTTKKHNASLLCVTHNKDLAQLLDKSFILKEKNLLQI